eukprot:3915293-Prymnesium_polylepis.4
MFGMEIKDKEMLKTIFEKLDVTKDGNIDRSELKAALEEAVRTALLPPLALPRNPLARPNSQRSCPDARRLLLVRRALAGQEGHAGAGG